MADINLYGQPGSKLNTPSLSEWAGAVVDVLNGDNTTVDARITAALAGVTVPSGGTADQIIVKIDGTDGNYEWRDNGGPTVTTINQYDPTALSWTNFNSALATDGFGGNGNWTTADGSRQLVRTGNIIQYFDGPNAVNYIVQRFANTTSNVMAIKPGGLFLYNAANDSSVPTARSKIEPTAVNTATLTSPGTLTIDTDATMAAGHHLTLDADPVNNLHAATKQYVDNNGGGASNLDGLTDVTITNPQADQILGYNGSAWVNTVNSGGGGTSDHGALTGLGDDDHTQYLNNARGDARYYTQSQVDTSLSGKANTSHTHTLSNVTDAGTAAALNVPAAGDASATEVVKGNDTRLTDARTPTAHTHTESQITDLGAYPDATGQINGKIARVLNNDWEFVDEPSGGGATDLNSLTDVNTAGVVDNDILQFNSGTGNWEPSTLTAGAVDYADLPAGTTITVYESGGSYIRPTLRTDITVVFTGPTDPGTTAVTNVDKWDQTV